MLAQAALRGVSTRALLSLVEGGLPASAVTFTRASPATVWRSDLGTFQSFSTAAPRRDGDGRLVIEPSATELAEYTTTPANWDVVNATVTATGDTGVLGLFAPARVASNGQSWHRARVLWQGDGAVGDTFVGEIVYAAGTSGRVRISIRNQTTSGESRVVGSIGSITVTQQFAGPLSVDETELVAGIHRASFTVTLSAAAAAVTFEVGPDTATAGEDVVVYGGSVKQQAHFDSWIETTGAPVTRAADACMRSASASEGTVTWNGALSTAAARDGSDLVRISDGTDANVVSLRVVSGSLHALVIAGNVTEADLDLGAVGAGTVARVAWSLEAGAFRACRDGGTVASAAPSALPPGTALSAGPGLHETVRQYPAASTAARLQDLTTPS